MRPDGSHKRNITNTPNINEIGARLSPDGLKLLYRRVAPGVKIRHDAWGSLGLSSSRIPMAATLRYTEGLVISLGLYGVPTANS